MTISLPSDTTITQITRVLEGDENVINTILQFVSNTKVRIDACIDYSRPSLAIEFEVLKKAFLSARRRDVRLRYVTEITKNNIIYCRELIKMVDELRHLEGIKGNFYLSEAEYIAPAAYHVKGKPASHIVYSSVKDIVEFHQRYIFEAFWNRATSAEQQIYEIEAADKK
jgi:two-component system, OmpR family, sensor histidine kinase VicK